MKNLSFSKLLSLLFLFCCPLIVVNAQKGDPNENRNDSHFLTISLSGGVSSFNLMPVPDTLKVTSLPFLGGSLGFGYEWHHSSGAWLGVGVEGQLLTGKLNNTQDIYHIDGVVDAENDTSDIAYNIVTWREMQRLLSVNLPIMAGYKFESGFYFGAGLKVGLGVYADVTSDFEFTDCVVFYQKYPPMALKEPVSRKGIVSSDKNFTGHVNVSPAFEIGWQGLDIKGSDRYSGGVRFKFALCGEFGALSSYVNRGEGNLLNYKDLNGFSDLKNVMNLLEGVNSYYSTMPVGISKGDFATLKNSGKFTAYGNSSNLHSWYVGVKVGVMFEMPKKKECNCLNNNVTKPWFKSRKEKGVE